MSDSTSKEAVDRFLDGVESGEVPTGVFRNDAVLDATVPNWRFSVEGAVAVREELSRWYADPGHFDDLRRTPLPDGELVEFVLTWQEGGITHRCHQAHILGLADGRIERDTAFCGGRWPASLIAEMESATS